MRCILLVIIASEASLRSIYNYIYCERSEPPSRANGAPGLSESTVVLSTLQKMKG